MLGTNIHTFTTTVTFPIPISRDTSIINLHRMANCHWCLVVSHSHLPQSGNTATLYRLCIRGIFQVTYLLCHRDEVYGDYITSATQQQWWYHAHRRRIATTSSVTAHSILRGSSHSVSVCILFSGPESNIYYIGIVFILGSTDCVKCNYRSQNSTA